MTLGQKIKILRTKNNLTQKDLAEKVHVTFQTISKWENNENEPDITTLRELAKLFDCSLDYLLSEDESDAATQSEEKQTIVIHQKEMHVCERCKKDIPEDDLAMEDIRIGFNGRGHRAHYQKAYYHKHCLEETINERKIIADKKKAYEAKQNKKKVWAWSISAGVLGLIVGLLIFFLGTKDMPTFGSIGLGVLAGLVVFCSVYCIISGSYLGDVFLWCSSLSIKFPRLIFSWDIDGFIWVIAMKILFAILGFMIGVLVLVFSIVLTGALGIVSFPFVLVHNINTGYMDTL